MISGVFVFCCKLGMMNRETSKLADHLSEIYDGDPWYGENIKTKLQSLTYIHANWKPHPDANSIAQLVKHMTVWKDLVVRKLKDNDPVQIEIGSKEDWDRNLLVNNEEEWQDLVHGFYIKHRELIDMLGRLQDEDLERQTSGRNYDMQFLVHGIYEHDIYHLGQIGYVYSLWQKMSN
jgi:hypothetical protein